MNQDFEVVFDVNKSIDTREDAFNRLDKAMKMRALDGLLLKIGERKWNAEEFGVIALLGRIGDANVAAALEALTHPRATSPEAAFQEIMPGKIRAQIRESIKQIHGRKAAKQLEGVTYSYLRRT